jgi:hypothetical protein
MNRIKSLFQNFEDVFRKKYSYHQFDSSNCSPKLLKLISSLKEYLSDPKEKPLILVFCEQRIIVKYLDFALNKYADLNQLADRWKSKFVIGSQKFEHQTDLVSSNANCRQVNQPQSRS